MRIPPCRELYNKIQSYSMEFWSSHNYTSLEIFYALCSNIKQLPILEDFMIPHWFEKDGNRKQTPDNHRFYLNNLYSNS